MPENKYCINIMERPQILLFGKLNWCCGYRNNADKKSNWVIVEIVKRKYNREQGIFSTFHLVFVR